MKAQRYYETEPKEVRLTLSWTETFDLLNVLRKAQRCELPQFEERVRSDVISALLLGYES